MSNYNNWNFVLSLAEKWKTRICGTQCLITKDNSSLKNFEIRIIITAIGKTAAKDFF